MSDEKLNETKYVQSGRDFQAWCESGDAGVDCNMTIRQIQRDAFIAGWKAMLKRSEPVIAEYSKQAAARSAPAPMMGFTPATLAAYGERLEQLEQVQLGVNRRVEKLELGFQGLRDCHEGTVTNGLAKRVGQCEAKCRELDGRYLYVSASNVGKPGG